MIRKAPSQLEAQMARALGEAGYIVLLLADSCGAYGAEGERAGDYFRGLVANWEKLIKEARGE